MRIWFLLIFAVSGFSGLIYESIWSHYLKLFLGHAAYAQTLVLAIFMGGMALGAWLCSRYSVRWKNLLLGYALVEGITGVFALIFHDSFDALVQISYDSIIPFIGSPLSVNLYKWSVSSGMILPQSILLGMTFPLMASGVIRRFPQNPGRTIAMLYFSNSFGGAIGVLVSGFVLIKSIGLPGTIMFAGILNITLALVVWSMVRHHSEEAPGEAKQTLPELQPAARSQAVFYTMLAASLVTGVASFMYEIGWIRMLSMVLGSSTHAFELMLSAFIFGLAFGGLWIRRRIDKIKWPVHFVAWIQVIMGMLALSTLVLYGNSFNVMQWLLQNLDKTETGYTLFNLGSHGIALMIMLPTTFCAGTTLPLITYVLLNRGWGEKSIGAVYAANTVGAIIGVFSAVHLAMPLVGLKGLISLGAGLDIALGLFLLWRLSESRQFAVSAAGTMIALTSMAATVFWVELDSYKMASGVYRTSTILKPEKGAQVLRHEDGKTASISLTKNARNYVAIRTNGKSDAGINMNDNQPGTVDEATMMLAAAIPLMLNIEAKTVANIGMGSGLTTHTLLTMPSIQRVDTVEIEKAMVEVAKGFQSRNQLVYSDPRSHIHIEDAKTFFSTHNQKYDIIVSEPSNPWVSGTASLFSEEFYSLVNRYISADGLFVQWLQLYEITPDLVASILKALAPNFDDFAIYASNTTDILLIAKPIGHMPALNEELFRVSSMTQLLRRIGIFNLQDIESRKIGSKQSLAPVLASYDIRPNSDYYPVVDQNAARARYMKKDAVDYISLAHEPIPALEILGVSAPTWQSSSVTPIFHFPRSEHAYKAQLTRDYLWSFIRPVIRNELEQQAYQFSNQIKNLFAECTAESRSIDRIAVLMAMALDISAYLRPEELEKIWQQLSVDHCSITWSEEERNWLAVVKAVGRRDAESMSVYARNVLDKGNRFTMARKKYLLAAAMLGYVATNNLQSAKQLWIQYETELFPDSEPAMMFRLLAIKSGAME